MKFLVLLFGVVAVGAFSASDRRVLEDERETLRLEEDHEEHHSVEKGSGMLMTANKKAQHNVPSLGLNEVRGHLSDGLGSATSVSQNGHSYMCPIMLTNKTIPSDLKLKATTVKRESNILIPCNASWAFAAAGALEGHHYKKSGKLISLSAQNLLSCSRRRYGGKHDNCTSGTPEGAFKYVVANGGINGDRSYPDNYTGLDVLTCKYKSAKYHVSARGYVKLPIGDEDCLLTALLEVGPVVVGIDDHLPSFDKYKEGVYYDRACTTNIRRWVLLVGYGSEQPGGDFWWIKNSQGTSWGINGYMKLARNRGNHCGVASRAIYPLV